VAERRFDTAAFEAFCAEHLPHLDEVAWEFFATNTAREAIRVKVAALFPAHEVEQFTELFWSRIQRWRSEESSGTPAAASATATAGAMPPAATAAATPGDGAGPPATRRRAAPKRRTTRTA
jgi:hypothetical protein